jgi:hypothetical protein
MDLSDQIRAFLGDITLADLVARQEIRTISDQQGNRIETGETPEIPLSNV